MADPRETSNSYRAHLHFNCGLKCLNPKRKNKKPAKVRLSGTTRGPVGKLSGVKVMGFHGLFLKPAHHRVAGIHLGEKPADT